MTNEIKQAINTLEARLLEIEKEYRAKTGISRAGQKNLELVVYQVFHKSVCAAMGTVPFSDQYKNNEAEQAEKSA